MRVEAASRGLSSPASRLYASGWKELGSIRYRSGASR